MRTTHSLGIKRFKRGQLINVYNNPFDRGLVIDMDREGNVNVYFFQDMTTEWVYHIHLRGMRENNSV